MMIFPVSRRRFLHTAALAAGGLATVTRFANARAWVPTIVSASA